MIKSEKDDKLYIGFTSDLRRRLSEHNNKKGKSTWYRAPFNLIYYEAYAAEKDAKTRETQLKRFSGACTHLKRRIKNSLILFK